MADNGSMRAPTSALAGVGLIAGYGVATASGSRPVGGLVLAACGVPCIVIWLRRHDRRTAALLTLGGLAAFALSHGIGILIGPWPAVVLTAALTSTAYWRLSDSRRRAGRRGHLPAGSSLRV
jgi:tetrahydromethanopterin S-methyltransferase subunit C